MKKGTESRSALNGQRIGISISDSHQLRYLGYGPTHQKDAVIEFARYLLAQNARLVYGHDLRHGGYARLVTDLARSYAQPNDDQSMFTNYLAWPIHLTLEETDFFEFSELGIDAVCTPLPEDELPQVPREEFLPPNSIESRYAWARSLTHMRQLMTEATDARIFLGGQIKANKQGNEVKGYKGLMPGVVEEGLLALRGERKSPLYFLGAFGGASRAMIEAVKGNQPLALTEEYQIEHYPDYADFLQFYRAQHGEDSLDYKKIVNEFAELGIEGLSQLNGLSIEENERLFETPHISEMVRLVLKGLTRVKLSTFN